MEWPQLYNVPPFIRRMRSHFIDKVYGNYDYVTCMSNNSILVYSSEQDNALNSCTSFVVAIINSDILASHGIWP